MLRIEGIVDRCAPVPPDRALAEGRATTVWAALRDRGMPSELLVTETHDSAGCCGPSLPSHDHRHHRVELSVLVCRAPAD